MANVSGQEHERGLARFLTRERRPRFLAALNDERLREKLREKLAHFAWLDERYVERAPTEDVPELAARLRSEGAATTCVVVSADPDLDGRELDLENALHVVLDDDYAALISCVPGQLALFADEAPDRAPRILRRR